MSDYRNTKYCVPLEGIGERKQKVKELVLTDHPRAKDMHAYISKNGEPYKSAFMKAYNYKCAYCGASVDLISKVEFEIDHFVNQQSDDFKSKKDAGTIENLVLACHDCNHCKSGFAITDENKSYFDPDDTGISSLFYRDDMFYISIEKESKARNDVVSFYNQLRLGSEIHRIDYLVMSMIGLQKELKKKGQESDLLANAIQILITKRNLMNV